MSYENYQMIIYLAVKLIDIIKATPPLPKKITLRYLYAYKIQFFGDLSCRVMKRFLIKMGTFSTLLKSFKWIIETTNMTPYILWKLTEDICFFLCNRHYLDHLMYLYVNNTFKILMCFSLFVSPPFPKRWKTMLFACNIMSYLKRTFDT